MTDAISINNLSKIYPTNNKIALDNINLTIPSGSFFGLLGPNGAGKSTLINILAGIVKKTSGVVSICDVDIDKNLQQAKYCIGIVPQELILDPFFTAREMLEYYAGYYGVAKGKRKTDEIIEALGLTDKANTRPRALSGGMQRRLLIGKALVHSPKVLILDEPTAGVDIELRQQLWKYIKRLNEQGTTIILTTHYLEEAEELCDHIAIVNHGKLIKNSSTEELLSILNYKIIKVYCTQKIDSIPKAFDSIMNAILDIKIDIEKNMLLVKYNTQMINADKIIHILSQTDMSIKDIITEQASLEDIFTYLINN